MNRYRIAFASFASHHVARPEHLDVKPQACYNMCFFLFSWLVRFCSIFIYSILSQLVLNAMLHEHCTHSYVQTSTQTHTRMRWSDAKNTHWYIVPLIFLHVLFMYFLSINFVVVVIFRIILIIIMIVQVLIFEFLSTNANLYVPRHTACMPLVFSLYLLLLVCNVHVCWRFCC